ncbi:sialate O-acetylesterase [Spirosoma pomorum]
MQLTSLKNRQIVQRSIYNSALVTVQGTYEGTPAKVQARFVPVRDGQGTATGWKDLAFSNGTYDGDVLVRGGWYKIEVQALTAYNVPGATAGLDRFGVGEVFVIAGHSVAQGNKDYIDGTADDRVNTIPLDTPVEDTQHVKTGLLADMPTIKFAQFGTGVRPAPFGPNNYFWSKFGELVAQKENVPVLIYQAAFGGTSLEHWARSANGEAFPLFTVNPAIGMPYVNLKHTLQRYVPVTGLRAMLFDMGQNDTGEPNGELLYQRYMTVLSKARTDANAPNLTAVITRQTPYLTVDSSYQGGLPPQTYIRTMQERVSSSAKCVPGPDYDTGLTVTDRFDNIHLSIAGQTKAAGLWAGIITPRFLRYAEPIILKAVPVETLPELPAETTTPISTTPTTGLINLDTGAGLGLTADDDELESPLQSRTRASIPLNSRNLANLALIGFIFLCIAGLFFYLYQSNFFNNVVLKSLQGDGPAKRHNP